MVASLAFRLHPPQKAQLNCHQLALQRSTGMVLSRTLMSTYRPTSQENATPGYSCATVGVVSFDNATKTNKVCIIASSSWDPGASVEIYRGERWQVAGLRRSWILRLLSPRPEHGGHTVTANIEMGAERGGKGKRSLCELEGL